MTGSGDDDAVLGAPPVIPEMLWERVLATTFRAEDLDALESDAADTESDSWDGASEAAGPDPFEHPFMIASAAENTGDHGMDEDDD
jgi:hypothetical protein